jgi:hypothetical protein
VGRSTIRRILNNAGLPPVPQRPTSMVLMHVFSQAPAQPRLVHDYDVIQAGCLSHTLAGILRS